MFFERFRVTKRHDMHISQPSYPSDAINSYELCLLAGTGMLTSGPFGLCGTRRVKDTSACVFTASFILICNVSRPWAKPPRLECHQPRHQDQIHIVHQKLLNSSVARKLQAPSHGSLQQYSIQAANQSAAQSQRTTRSDTQRTGQPGEKQNIAQPTKPISSRPVHGDRRRRKNEESMYKCGLPPGQS